MDLQVVKISNPQDLPKLREGERVEVRQKDVGLRGSWHPGTIVGLKGGRRLVEYDELLTDDGLSKLRESIPCAKVNEKPTFPPGFCTPQKNAALLATSTRSPSKRRGLLRPSPPLCIEPSPLTWKGGLFVDVFYQDAWWEAVLLTDITSLDDDALIDVIYPDEGDLARVNTKDLRISQCWDEVTGEWSIKGSVDLQRFLRRWGVGRKEVDLTLDSGSEGGIFQNSFTQGEVGINEKASNQLLSSDSKCGGENALAAVIQASGSAAVPSSGNETNNKSLPLHSHRHLASDKFSTDEDINQMSLPLACSRNSGTYFDPVTSKGTLEISRYFGRSEHDTYEGPQHPKFVDGDYMLCGNDTMTIGSGKEIVKREDVGECTSSPFAKAESIYDNLRFKRRRIGEAHVKSCEGEAIGSKPTMSTPLQNHQLETFKLIQEESSFAIDRSLDRGSTSYSGVVHDGRPSNLDCSAIMFQEEAMQQSFVSEGSDLLQKNKLTPFFRGNVDCENELEKENKRTDIRPVSKKHLLALEAPVRKSREEYDQITSAGKPALEGDVHDGVVRSGRQAGKEGPARKSLGEYNQITSAGKSRLEGCVLESVTRSGRQAGKEVPVQKFQEEKDIITSAGKATSEGVHERVVRLGGQAGELSRSVCKAERRGRKDTLRSFKDRLLRQKQADALKRKASKTSSISEMGGKNDKLLKASKPYGKPDQVERATASWLSNCEDRNLKSLAREIGKKAILEAGFTIHHKPRRGKLSLDAIYTSPKGHSYWSLPKAWQALAKEERKGRVRVEKGLIQQVLSKIDNDENVRSAFEKLDKFAGTCLEDVIRHMTYAELTDVLLEDLRVLRKNMPKFRGRKHLGKGKSGKNKSGKTINICANSKNDTDSKTSLRTSESVIVKRRGRKRKQECESFLQEVDCRMLTSKVSSRIELLQGGSLPKLEKNRSLMREGTSGTSNQTPYRLKGANKAPIRAASSLIGPSIEKSRNNLKVSIKNNAIEVKQEPSRKKEKALKPRSGFRLEVRPSSSSMDDESEDLSCQSKRTVASWMIDRGAVLEKERIFYVDQLSNKIFKEGVLTREGILCRCCKKIYTIQNFEQHGGSQEKKSHCNLIFTSGRSFLDCRLEAWNAEILLRKTHKYKGVTASDTNDDTCLLCGDGGILLCCDLCPSTFHASCLQLDNVPDGTWYCPKCRCGVCRGRHGSEEEEAMAVCSQCEHRYHIACLCGGNIIVQTEFFCGPPCKKIYSGLRNLVGITHSLDKGFSWTLLRCMENGDIKLAMENNSKLAVALLVLKECFNPMDDPRTNIDMITHALYNRWSQFDRLNYVGFYTAVLERDDEIISVASIRIHGARLAEMPLIGTRHKYRRQGMCRLLVGVIEKLLCSLEVATFILPAISELFETWTQAFGFRPLDASQRSQIKEVSMMMFPGTDLLQKPMLGSSTGKAALLRKHITAAELPQSADAIPFGVCQKLQNKGSSRMATIGTGLLHNTSIGSPRGNASLAENPDLDLLLTDDGDDDMFFDSCQNLQITDSSMMAEMDTGSLLNSSSESPTAGGLLFAEGLVTETRDGGLPKPLPSSDFWDFDRVLLGDSGSVDAESSLNEARDGGSRKSETSPIQTDLTSLGSVWSLTAGGILFEIRDAKLQKTEQSFDCMQIDQGSGGLIAEGTLHEAWDGGSQQLEARLYPKQTSLGGDGINGESLKLKPSSPESIQTDSALLLVGGLHTAEGASVVERVGGSPSLKLSSDCMQTDSVLQGGDCSLTAESTLCQARIDEPLRPESTNFLGSDFASLGGRALLAAEFSYIEGRHAISQKPELSSDSALLDGCGSPVAEGSSFTGARDSGLEKLEPITDPVQTNPLSIGGVGSLSTKGLLLQAWDGDMQKLQAASESNQTDLSPLGGGLLTVEGRSIEKGAVVCRS